MISALILTKNEELDLSGCLASLSWCDDIHVFDSFSEDRTPEIARNAGATLKGI
jgi:glycosyltransferase involved in cell wall biosynthesis